MTHTRRIKKLTKMIESQDIYIKDLFSHINPDYILRNESSFNKAFTYFTPNEYETIKKFKSYKAINTYVTKYKLNEDEQQFWLNLAHENGKRIKNLEIENLEYIKSFDTEFAYEILLKNKYICDSEYSSKEPKSIKLFKKLACSSFPHLETMLVKHSVVEPYAIRIFYTGTKVDKNSQVYSHIAKMHTINPTFYTSFLLDEQPNKKALRGLIDKNMLYLLSDYLFLSYLLDEYKKNEDKMCVVQLLLQHKRKIQNLEKFVLFNSLVPELISKFLSIITGSISNKTDWFSIFYHENICYKKYYDFYCKIYVINHFIVFDLERIDYFMHFPFYKKNFIATFDPLNYSTLIHDDFIKKYSFYRKDLYFYQNLPSADKENINPLYSKSPAFSRIENNSDNYYNSFRCFTPDLIQSKLGIFYIEKKIHEIEPEKMKKIIEVNRLYAHPLNDYIDKFVWNNFTDISSFITGFKKQHDNNLNNIIKNLKCKIDINIYSKYKSYASECAKHIAENYSINEMISNYHKNPDLMMIAFSYKLDIDFDQTFNALSNNTNLKPILSSLLIIAKQEQLSKIFDIYIRDVQNNTEILFVIAGKNNKLFEKLMLAIKDICTIDDAKKIFKIKNSKNIKINFEGNLFFNIAVRENAQSLISVKDDIRYLLQIQDYYVPYVVSNFDYIISRADENNCEEWAMKCIKLICIDDVILFTLKDKIKQIIKENPKSRFINSLRNKNGYFTNELFIMSKKFETTRLANKILQTTEIENFLQLPDKEMINYLHSMTFDCYLDEVSANYLLSRIDNLLFTMQKTTFEREFCKNVFRTVQTLDEIIFNTDYNIILCNLIKLICDDRFTAELADIFDKLATNDLKIVDMLKKMLDKNINISKILVSILMRIEKQDPEYVEKMCALILTDEIEEEQFDRTKAVINFLAYAPALKSFAKYKNNFLIELKRIYLGTDVSVATKAFTKLYDKEIRNFIICSSFKNGRKSEALAIIEKNFDANDANVFAFIYVLKFDINEKIRSKAHELWIKNFKQGVINAIIPYLISMCYYYHDEELLFESAAFDFISKYSENIEKKLLGIINSLKNCSESLEPEIIEIKRTGCLQQNDKNFVQALTDAICFFIKEGLKMNLLKDSAIIFLHLHVDIEIVQELLHEQRYQNDLLAMILDNKIEFEVVLENKRFVDEIYKKTNDTMLLPYLSVDAKMKELINNPESKVKIFTNITPSKEWEQFLSTAMPIFSKYYLINYVSDFGGLKLIFERVCEECYEIDELIDIFYIDYIKDVSFKNFKDKKLLIKLLIATKKYRRLRELQSDIDMETMCHLLKLSLVEPEIVGVLAGHEYEDKVINDYVESVNQ